MHSSIQRSLLDLFVRLCNRCIHKIEFYVNLRALPKATIVGIQNSVDWTLFNKPSRKDKKLHIKTVLILSSHAV